MVIRVTTLILRSTRGYHTGKNWYILKPGKSYEFRHVTVPVEVKYEDLITLADGVHRVPLAIRHAIGRDGSLHHTGVDL